jgi:hypothetical protein
MTIYADQIASTLELIAEKGQLVQWRQIRDTVPDAAQPWNTGAASHTDTDVSIVFLPINKEMRETLAFFGDTELLIGMTMGLMGAYSFTPSAKDIVIRDGVELKLFSVNTLAPDGPAILHTIVFQK